jgi:predicted Zn-dependent protease
MSDYDLHAWPEEAPPRPKWVRVLHISVSVLTITGLLYISGISQATRYQRTSTETPQTDVAALLDADVITVPLRLFVFQNNDSLGSARDEENVRATVRRAEKIWNQADIQFEIDKIVFLHASDADIDYFFDKPTEGIHSVELYEENAINIFFARTIQGINGIAYGGLRVIGVADFTTVYDFRTFAHEIGHIFGLSHTTDDKNKLMHSGTNGFTLTPEEALRARDFALDFQ